jgi:hypothetical protein
MLASLGVVLFVDNVRIGAVPSEIIRATITLIP